MTDPGPDLGELLSQAVAAAQPGIYDRIGTDPSAHLDLVALAAQADLQTTMMLQSAVAAARSAGHSWEAIGTVLNMTRQAAQQRFGRGATPPSTSDNDIRTLSPLTAFNEMEVLARVGAHGWHCIGFGALYHTVRRSPWQWEHQRVYVLGHSRRSLEAANWERVGNQWFPWAYYKRRLDLPAVDEESPEPSSYFRPGGTT